MVRQCKEEDYVYKWAGVGGKIANLGASMMLYSEHDNCTVCSSDQIKNL